MLTAISTKRKSRISDSALLGASGASPKNRSSAGPAKRVDRVRQTGRSRMAPLLADIASSAKGEACPIEGNGLPLSLTLPKHLLPLSLQGAHIMSSQDVNSMKS